MVNTRFALIVIWVLLVTQVGMPPRSWGNEAKCSGKYKGRLTPLSEDELAEILKQHNAWAKDAGPLHLNNPKVANDPRRANLCEANLRHALLTGAFKEVRAFIEDKGILPSLSEWSVGGNVTQQF
jgi:hypothetical protein